MKKFYITTAIPYVNAAPHIGHALEFTQADVLARYHRLNKESVILLSGADENALKNVQAAEKTGQPVQEFVDNNAKLFQKLAENLNVKFDVFQKGSNPNHFQSSQDLWNRCFKNGDIYQKEYRGLYCIGCEAFYTPEELNEKGECIEHPGKKLVEVAEKNWFFRLSKYQNDLIKLLKENDDFKIIPSSKLEELSVFLQQPLHDISISRSNERAKNWGVPVPNDPTQRMYVWFDALNIYRSGVDQTIWPADIHLIGKGITRFHAIYWPAFLMSAKLPLPKKIFIHGYITIEGQKMSKTIGNVIDPFVLINQYGVDAVRYYLLKEIPTFADGDFSASRMQEIYNSDLANELGNLVSRLTTLAEKDKLDMNKYEQNDQQKLIKVDLDSLEVTNSLTSILEEIWITIKKLNKETDNFAPWHKTAEERKEFLQKMLTWINNIGIRLLPFLPETAEKIIKATTGQITKISPLFPRLVDKVTR